VAQASLPAFPGAAASRTAGTEAGATPSGFTSRVQIHRSLSVMMVDGFEPYDPHAPVHVRRRRLPHWQQDGATYFVTFRLADALPADALTNLDEQRRLGVAPAEAWAWLDRYLDAGSGCGLLARPDCSALVDDTLRHFDGQRYNLGAFVIMHNHVHVLVQPTGTSGLAAVLHGWKSYSAHQLHRYGLASGAVWQSESFDRLVRDDSELERFQRYILENPAKARLPDGRFLAGRGNAIWAR